MPDFITIVQSSERTEQIADFSFHLSTRGSPK